MFSLLPLLSLIVPFFIGVLFLFTCLFWFLESFFKKIEKISLLFATSLTLFIVLSMLPYVLAGETLETSELSLRVDLTNVAGIFGVALIFFLTSIYNVKAEKGGRLKPGLYNFFVLLFLVCMLGLLLSYDLFGIFFFVELTIGVSIILVAHAPGKLSPEAAFKYLIITAISALFVLLGVLTVFIVTHNSSISAIMSNPYSLIENSRLLLLVVACFIVGLGADIGLVPFHGWVPDVFPASTPIINSFFCAEPIALIFALYKLIYPFYVVYPSAVIISLVVGVGLVSMAFGVFMAYPQKDFMRMIAYCSIDEFGHMVFALGLFTSLSFTAGQLYLVNGALMKAGILQCLGSVFITSGTQNMDSLGGLVRRMKKTSGSYIICVLSLAGVPPLSGFYAKWLLYNAVYDFLLPQAGVFISVLALISLVGVSTISFIFLVRSFHRIFLGQLAETSKNIDEVHWTMWFPTAFLAGVAILVGLQPYLLLSLIRPP
ncbi:MAG: proton-conducting transporter membrane subunit [Candidatus Bathyarchaeia archaeon]